MWSFFVRFICLFESKVTRGTEGENWTRLKAGVSFRFLIWLTWARISFASFAFTQLHEQWAGLEREQMSHKPESKEAALAQCTPQCWPWAVIPDEGYNRREIDRISGIVHREVYAYVCTYAEALAGAFTNQRSQPWILSAPLGTKGKIKELLWRLGTVADKNDVKIYAKAIGSQYANAQLS